MKQTFRDFLAARLAAFQAGDFWEATKDLRLPAPVYRDGEVEVYPTQRKYVEHLKTCFAELKLMGWARTDLDLRRLDEDTNGGARALVRWTSRKSGGDIINICDVAYFCEYSKSEGWKISMTEVISKWAPDLGGPSLGATAC